MSDVVNHNTSVLSKLEIGDTVEFKRGGYSHYGVYIGDEEIVHLSGDAENGDLNFGGKSNKASVQEEKFLKVAGDSKAYKANKLDNDIPPLERSEIVANALSKVGQRGYNLLTNNCEHFANSCRYGWKTSTQVDKVLGGLTNAPYVTNVSALPYSYESRRNEIRLVIEARKASQNQCDMGYRD